MHFYEVIVNVRLFFDIVLVKYILNLVCEGDALCFAKENESRYEQLSLISYGYDLIISISRKVHSINLFYIKQIDDILSLSNISGRI